jgi:hypothetical protein
MDRQSLEAAISGLRILTGNESALEEEFQEWFERNSVVFHVLRYQRVLSHPRLTESGIERYVLDFLGQRLDKLWEIVEIKRPDTEILKNLQRRTAFYAAMETYVSQCVEYSRYFNDRANRSEFAANYQARVQQQPSAILVAGRSHGLDREKVHQLLMGRTPTVCHQTYDDVLNQLEFQRAKLYSTHENLVGFSIHLVLMLTAPLTPGGGFILDIGTNTERDRLSVSIHSSGSILFTVVDSLGVSHQLSVPPGEETFQYEKTFYLNLEVGCGTKCAVMVAEINGRCCSEQKLSSFPFEVAPPLPLIVGSDVTGQGESFMRLADSWIYDRTLEFQEKNKLRDHVFRKYKSYMLDSGRNPKSLEFMGRQFLYTKSHPLFSSIHGVTEGATDLVQADPGRRPVFRIGN